MANDTKSYTYVPNEDSVEFWINSWSEILNAEFDFTIPLVVMFPEPEFIWTLVLINAFVIISVSTFLNDSLLSASVNVPIQLNFSK